MSDDKKRGDRGDSPWIGKKETEVEAADLPEEVYGSRIEDDDVKIERAIANARLLASRSSEAYVCWACGAVVPLRFREPGYGILVCHSCLCKAVKRDSDEKLAAFVEAIETYLDAFTPVEDEDDDEGEDGTESDSETTSEDEQGPEPEPEADAEPQEEV